MNVSKNNFQNKMQAQARQVPHWSLRKLTVGVASVLLGTTFYFGMGAVAHADTVASTTPASGVEQPAGEQTNVQTGNSVTLQNNGQPSAGNPATNQVASGDNHGSQTDADGASTQSFSVPTNEHPTPANVWESSAVSTLNNNETTENKTVTETISVKETINITNPNGTMSSHNQGVYFSRTKNTQTGEVTDWKVMDGAANVIPEYNLPEFKGYTAYDADNGNAVVNGKVSAVHVTGNMDNFTVNVAYRANKIYREILIKDENGQVVNTGNIEGIEGASVNVPADLVPDGYVKDDGTVIPAKITMTTDMENPVYKVHALIVHVTKDNTQQAGTLIHPTKGRYYPSGLMQEDLERTITRTINVIHADGKSGEPKYQYTHLTRTADVNAVTGHVTYTAWTYDRPTYWDAYTVSVPAGQEAFIDGVKGSTVPRIDLNPYYQNVTTNVVLKYKDEAVQVIFYDQDAAGANPTDEAKLNAEVGEVTKSGAVNSTIDLTTTADEAGLDNGYEFVQPTNKYQITPDNNQVVFVPVKSAKLTVSHDNPAAPGTDIPGHNGDVYPDGVNDRDLNQTITRTIKVTDQNGKVTTTSQVAKIYRDATVNAITGDVTYTDWSTDATHWTAVTPVAIPGYTTHITTDDQAASDIPAVTVKDGQKNVNVNVSYTANDHATNLQFVDDQGNKVGDPVIVNGKTDETKKLGTDYQMTVPTGWELDANQAIPVSIAFGADGYADVNVKIHHKTDSISHDKPAPQDQKTPTGKPYDGGHESDLNQTIIRTINVTDPSGHVLTETQTAKIFRDATVDEVTGHVSYGNWSTDDKDWEAVTADNAAGYTTKISIDGTASDTIPAVTVKDGQQNVTVDIIYDANAQSMHVIYQDADAGNQEVKNDTLSGKTDQTVATNIVAPKGYDLVAGQDLPANVKFAADGHADIIVKLNHHQTPITHDAVSKIPTTTVTGKPVDKVTEDSMNLTVTRTIMSKVGNKASTKIDTQSGTIYRDGQIDEVTGHVKYGNWSTASISAYTAPAVSGYTVVNPNEAPAFAVTPDSHDSVITFNYSANAQSMKINYVAKDGTNVKTDTVNGHTDATVPTNSTVPTGWKLVENQAPAPETITFSATGNDDINITVEHVIDHVSHDNPAPQGQKTPTGKPYDGGHESDLNQTITRTVTIADKTGEVVKTVTQTAKIFRDADVDEVTGHVTYGNWSTDDKNWVAVTPDAIPGYTMHIDQDGSAVDSIPAVVVKDGQQNVNVKVTFSANDHQTKLSFVDDQGSVVGDVITVSGKTDETKNNGTDYNMTLPAGWKLDDGQSIPTEIAFGPEGHSDVTVKIHHGTTQVDHKNPLPEGKKTPSEKPIMGAHQDDLNRTVTRTINVKDSKGVVKTTTQIAQIFRDATVDDVTGNVTYGDWSTDADDWKAFDAPSIDGYTPTISHVDAVTVNSNTKDTTLDISYTANAAEMTLTFYDQNGKQVAVTPLKGKTDETVSVNDNLPDGWKLYDGQSVPTQVTFAAVNYNHDYVVKHVQVFVSADSPKTTDDVIDGTKGIKFPAGVGQNDLNKTITRTIIVKNAEGDEIDRQVQTVHFVRNAIVDAVDGTVTPLGWSEGGKHIFSSFIPEAKNGFTIENAKDLAVTPDSQDSTVMLQYKANAKSITIHYVKADGSHVADVKAQADSMGNISFRDQLPAGYKLSTSVDQVKASDLDEDEYDVLVDADQTVYTNHDTLPAAVTEPLTKTVTRTITIVMPNGRSRTIKQQVRFTRTATVTGDNKVTYGDWTSTGHDDFNKIHLANRHGYKLVFSDGSNGIAKVNHVTADTADTNITVSYVKA